jgi:hypothetical protein
MVYILVAIVVALALTCLYLWWRLSLKAASSLITLFTAESMIVRNLHPDSRPDFIVTKATESIKQVNVLLRPIAMWYIRSRGYAVATGFVRFIVFDLQADQRVTINK